MKRDAPDALKTWSHEVRNPIASMVLSAHALRQRVCASADLVEIADRIVQAGNRAMVILESAMETGGEPSQMALDPVLASQSLVESVQAHAAQADARGARAELRVGRSLAAPGYVDGRRFRHVLDNLISNAIRFAIDGRIRVVASVDRHRRLRVVVRDDGPGFEAASLDALRVRPGWSGPTLVLGGWGLGLRLARQMAEAMGGELTLVNARGAASGACVIVNVPLIDPGAMPWPAPARAVCAG